jgi:hypothetical protein
MVVNNSAYTASNDRMIANDELDTERSQDCSVGITTGHALDGRGLIPNGVIHVSLFHSFQTDTGAHPASYPILRTPSSEVKRPRREVYQSLPSNAEV